jgi:hypothetical protein
MREIGDWRFVEKAGRNLTRDWRFEEIEGGMS